MSNGAGKLNLAPFQKCPFELRYERIMDQQQGIYYTENGMLCYGPLVSELGGPECMVPQPRHWGVCAPPAPGSTAYASYKWLK